MTFMKGKGEEPVYHYYRKKNKWRKNVLIALNKFKKRPGNITRNLKNKNKNFCINLNKNRRISKI